MNSLLVKSKIPVEETEIINSGSCSRTFFVICSLSASSSEYSLSFLFVFFSRMVELKLSLLCFSEIYETITDRITAITNTILSIILRLSG